MRCDSLRLALFTDTFAPQVNGVARTLERLVAAVQERGGAVQVFTVGDDVSVEGTRDPALPAAVPLPHVVAPPPALAATHEPAPAIRFPSREFWAYRELRLAWPSQRAVRRELRAFRPTLVHAATEFGVGLAGRRAAHALRIPFVSSYHTSFAEYAQFYGLGMLERPGRRYLRWFHNGGLRTYCPTVSIARTLDEEGVRETQVWSRGVDTKRFNPAFRDASLRRTIGAGDDKLVVAYVGRLAAEKGLDVALDALRVVAEERPGKVAFACVGDGPYAATVRERAPAASWLPGRLTGDELSRAYASSDLFLFPSTTDTFGNVLLEAMASGMAVIGADVGPTRELVGDARGWLANPADPRDFAARIVAVIDDPGKLAGAQQQALAFAQSCTWERVWDSLIGDYLVLHRP